MMLDMLTADHHHSPPRRAPPPASGSFLQMPFSLLGSVLRKQNAPVTPAVDKVESPGPVPDSTNPPTDPMKTGSEAPISPTTSRPASVSSAASDGDRRKKRGPRPKTTYKLAQPPPSSHQKLHIRPKVLLQLHQVVASSRPRPVYEVIPYSILAPVSTRRLARTFRKDKLGAQDLLIVKAEEYGNNEDAKSDDERWGSRDVVGIICPGKEEKGNVVNTEVMMDNGSSWEVKAAPNGGYEFSYTDDHGLMMKARWITRPSVSRTQSIASTSTATAPDTRKFKFSTISANSRRHPVIATMTRDRIEVFDSYTMPSATSPTTPSHPSSALPTPAATPSVIDIESFMDKENIPVTTDDALRRFIVASGIWVAFCENWSPAYSSSKASCLTPLATQMAPRPAQPNRSISMTFVDSPRSASPSSIIDENKRTIPRIIRTGTQLLHRNASFDVSPKMASPSSSPTIKTRGRRSNSTGNAEIQSGNGNIKKRFGLGLGDQPLTETDEERQSKRSSELLRIKELSMPNSPSSPNQALTPVPSADPAVSERSLSSASSNPRTKKARSAYNPVTTAGLWDSGVSDSKGSKTRPTSLIGVQEKKKKARRKEARSRSKERVKEKSKERKEKTPRRKSEGFKQLFSGIFRRGKVAA